MNEQSIPGQPTQWPKDARVVHPYDRATWGTVVSQDRYSVIVRWDNGDVDSQGSEMLRPAPDEQGQTLARRLLATATAQASEALMRPQPVLASQGADHWIAVAAQAASAALLRELARFYERRGISVVSAEVVTAELGMLAEMMAAQPLGQQSATTATTDAEPCR